MLLLRSSVDIARPGAALAHLPALPQLRVKLRGRASVATIVLAAATLMWLGVFGYLAVARHLAGGTHAEDLGFTDQVLWNLLRGQWFRMSLYQGATWNTELDLSQVARPDSLLAFHVEPMLLAFVPLYALGGGAATLLLIQAIAVGLGAIPAYALGRHFGRSRGAGLAVSLAYLLSPLGQSAVLSDFHPSALAVPLLLLAAERPLVGHSTRVGLLAALGALSAREDVGPAVALLGVSLLVLGAARPAALLLVMGGVFWSVTAAAVLVHYSGGVSPFAARYGDSLGLGGVVAALGRPLAVQSYVTMLLSGVWLAVLAPLALLGAFPTLAANALSESPWMTASGAHYGVLLLPFVVLGAATGLGRLRRSLVLPACLMLVAVSAVGYARGGYGPFGASYAPASLTEHARVARELAGTLPADASVSASSTLTPHLSHRAHLYLFPAVLDAEYVYLDLHATSAPTSPGDVFYRVRDLLRGGGWSIETFSDGLLVLRRDELAPSTDIAPTSNGGGRGQGEPRLLEAQLVPSPDGALGPDGPRWILRTTWQTDQPLPPGSRLEFWLDLSGGERVHAWDIASLWWLPPERWTPGQPVVVDIPDVPARRFLSWRAAFTTQP